MHAIAVQMFVKKYKFFYEQGILGLLTLLHLLMTN